MDKLLKNKKIILIIGGGIAAYKSLDLIRLLKKQECEIKVVLTESGKKFVTRSTLKSKNTENLDGVDHFLHVRDVTMDSHPAYTGEKRFVDTAGRVEKFQSKFSRKR